MRDPFRAEIFAPTKAPPLSSLYLLYFALAKLDHCFVTAPRTQPQLAASSYRDRVAAPARVVMSNTGGARRQCAWPRMAGRGERGRAGTHHRIILRGFAPHTRGKCSALTPLEVQT